MSVPGVGPITALTYTSTIEDPRRFARSDDVGAYAGLVPRRSQSGERDTSGHISKAGDPMLRKALYEAAIRPSGVGQENGRNQRAQACQNSRCAEDRRITPFALAE